MQTPALTRGAPMNRFRLIAVTVSVPMVPGVLNAHAQSTDPCGLAKLRQEAQRHILTEVVLPWIERALAPQR